MSSEPTRDIFGETETVTEWLDSLAYDLEDIGVGLSQIVGAGRYDFKFSESELDNFIRHSLTRLVKERAKPRHWGSLSYPERDITLHYGNDTNEEIVEGVIADWNKMGQPDLEWGDFWFARPGTIKEG